MTRTGDADAIKTLVLALRYPHRASYYDDWADAFAAAPFFATTFLNVLDLSPSRLTSELGEHDLVVLLHNCTADTTDDLERLASLEKDLRFNDKESLIVSSGETGLVLVPVTVLPDSNCRRPRRANQSRES